MGVRYETAWRWFKQGHLPGEQLPSGTIVLFEPAERKEVAESEGVRAVVHGFFLLNVPDGEALTLQLPLFDALYRYCQELVSRQR